MGTVNQHQLSAFSSPVNGTTPIDANVVRGNANTIVTAYNAHDADTTIHLQNGAMASRPAASTAGQMWLATDSGAVFLTLDTGSAWVDIDYLKSTGGTVSGVVTLSAQPILSALTASQAVFTDASKGLVSVPATGSGSVVRAASPTISGLTLTGNSILGGTSITMNPTLVTINGTAILNGLSVTVGGSSGTSQVGFYGAVGTFRQLLATGAGHTVDDVITALQNVNLVRQS